jgi:hypothetical protein
MAHSLYEPLLELQSICIACATGQGGDARRYSDLRDYLVNDEAIRSRLPRFIRTCRDTGAFWSFIQPEFGTYAARRAFIRKEFQPLLEDLEHDLPSADREVTDILKRINTDTVRQVWERAQGRRVADPDGAITLARTLIETVCKHILDAKQILYNDGDDLTKLYRLTAEAIQISPSTATDDAFRRVFGGCSSIVESLGTIRNRIGDAHGRGVGASTVEPRYARLAVNLAGAMATFLVEASEASETA